MPDVKMQETCLVNETGAGAKYIHIMDECTPAFRQRLANSPFNVCLACLNPVPGPYVDNINIRNLEDMEARIRRMSCEEAA